MNTEMSARELAWLSFHMNMSGREGARQDILTYLDTYDEDDMFSIADLRDFILEMGFHDLEWQASDEGAEKVEEWEQLVIEHMGEEDGEGE